MNKLWKQFLAGQDTPLQNRQILITAENNALVDLGGYCLIKVSGADARSFLQNQVSNDLRNVNLKKSQLNSYCTPKGRMLCIFRVFETESGFYLRMPDDIVEDIQKRLQIYILRSKVTLQLDEELVGIGVAGKDSAKQLKAQLSVQLENIDDAVIHDDICILKVPGYERYEIYASVERIKSLWKTLSTSHTPHSFSLWRLLDIRNGIPNVYAATSEHFVPQMANMHLIDGVSFKKGCYPGQEIVARMQYLGKLKRRMYLVEFDSEQLPDPGSKILSIAQDETHEAGEIVDAEFISENTVQALAVLPIASAELNLHLLDANGPSLRLLELPYSFSEAS